MSFLINLVKYSFKKGHAYIKKFAKEIIKVNVSTLVSSYCKFIKNVIRGTPE
jgi:hypothetical protein